jgi:hypothetical protein
MVEAGKLDLVEIQHVEPAPNQLFKTLSGGIFKVKQPSVG